MTFCIVSWSGVHKAQAHYTCNLCKGAIPKKTVYRSFVLSNNRRDPKIGAYRVQQHLDCDLPWYQPSDVHRLHYVGLIPHAAPPPDEQNVRLENIPSFPIHHHSNRSGTIRWDLPPDFTRRLLHMRKIEEQTAAIYQMRMAIAAMADAVIDSASHQRRSRELQKHIFDIQSLSGLQPHQYDWGIPESVTDETD